MGARIRKQGRAVTVADARAAVAPKPYKKWALISSVGALCLLSILAHWKAVGAGEDYTGLLAPLDRVFDLMLSALLIGVCGLVGKKVCSLCSLRFEGFAEELCFAISLGAGVVGLMIFALGVSGLFRPLPVAMLAVALIALAHREGKQLCESAAAAVNRAMAKDRRVATILFLALATLLVIRAAEPPHAVDEAIYHLAAPNSFVKAGRLIPLYDNFSGNMPMLAHMFYVVCLIAKSDIAARLFSLSLAIVAALALYAFCVRYLNRRTGVLALFGFFGAGMVTEVAVTTRIDVTLAGMIFLATYAMINHLETGKRGWLIASALLSGTSLGVKYTAGIWIAMVGVMYVYESLFRKRERVQTFLANGTLFTVIAFAVFSPWLVKNYIYFKNPVYPFLTGEAAEHTASGIRFFTEDDERKMDAYLNQAQEEIPQTVDFISRELADREMLRFARHPFRFWEFFTAPEKYSMGLAEGHHDPNYLFLVSPLLFVFTRRRWLSWLGLISAGFFCFVASTSWIARYYLPLYPAMTVLAASSLVMISEKFSKYSGMAKHLPVIATATAVLLTAFVFAVQIQASGGVEFLTGSLSRREFLQGAFYSPPIDYINHNTPPGAKIMMVGAQMGYHLQRDYLADAGWDSVEWQRLMIRNNSLAEIHDDMKRQGITHIIYEPGLFGFVASMGRAGSGPSGAMYGRRSASRAGKDYQVQLRNWATFELYRSKYLETIQTFDKAGPEYIVLKVK